MSGYGIDDVPTLALNDAQRENLLSEDNTQAVLMAEAVIQVSENDQAIGPISKLDSHSGAGEYHRAFSVLLFNSNNELLLQRRSMEKVTFPGVWANSCCSHPLHSEEELDETNAIGVKRAAIRKLEQELGISPESISIEDFVFMTKMRYSSRMNPEWIEAEEAVAPWFRCIAARIMNPNWWGAIGNRTELEALSDELIHDMGDVSHMLPNAIGADLITSIKEVKPLVEQRIESSLRASRHPRLADAMMHLIEGGGKRMRATLPWLVAKAVGDTHSGLLDIGAAIETVHNFTLVHDDIMDDDDVRRGRNAVHIEYDMPTAINAGDAMLAIAFERLVQAENLEPRDVAPLVNRIAWMVRRVSEGQQLDIEFEERLNVSEEDYLEMIEGKTAVMFLTCAEIGARVSGADDEVIQLMAQWGLSVGLCFQLMDDLIDVLSDSATLGKPAGSDVAQGKRTLMVIHALQQPDSEAKEILLKVLGKGEDVAPEDLQAGLIALDELGSIAYAREKAVAYHAEAHECLDQLGDGPAMVALRELTDFQLARIH